MTTNIAVDHKTPDNRTIIRNDYDHLEMLSEPRPELVQWSKELDALIVEYASVDKKVSGITWKYSRYDVPHIREAAFKSGEGFDKEIQLTKAVLSQTPFRLCSCCEALKIADLPPREKSLAKYHLDHEQVYDQIAYKHHESLLALKRSAQSGCHFCIILWHTLLYKSQGEEELNKMFRLSENPTSQRISIMQKWEVWKIEAPHIMAYCGNTISWDMGLLNLQEDYRHQILSGEKVGYPVETDPLSPKAVAKIRGWIETCTQDHTGEFCPSTQVPELPTRVIDVGSPDGQEKPRLILSHGHHAHYFALSHSWGKSLAVRTLSTNINAHLQAITLSILPQNYQDAITVTRKLGQRYLWIDSLCIIQDSKEDWEIESAKMASLYTNAFLTISACSAVDSQSGFLKVRDPRGYLCAPLNHCNIPGCRISIRWPDPYRPTEYLFSRAWAKQEHHLSRRVLLFSSEQLIFECATQQIWEYGLVRQDLNVAYKRLFEAMRNEIESRVTDGVELPVKKNGYLDVYGPWRDFVKDYQATNITYPSDCLPALSGMAANFHLATKDTYLAGMWRASLLEDMLWSPQSAVERLDFYRAPSWSWAAVECRSKFDSGWEETTLTPTILKAETQVAGLNPFGAVNSGFIEMSGILQTLLFETIPEEWANKDSLLVVFKVPISWEVIDKAGHMKLNKSTISIEFDGVESYSGTRLWFLPMMANPGQKTNTHSGLVLIAAESAMTFVRVGRFRFEIEHFSWFEKMEVKTLVLV